MTVLSTALGMLSQTSLKAQDRLPATAGPNLASGGLLNTGGTNGSSAQNMQRYGEIGWLYAVVARISSSVGSNPFKALLAFLLSGTCTGSITESSSKYPTLISLSIANNTYKIILHSLSIILRSSHNRDSIDPHRS